MNQKDTLSDSSYGLTDSDLKSLEERGKILVAESHEAFNIPISSIESINVKITSLIQILTALGAIGIAIIIFLFGSHYQYSVISVIFGWISAGSGFGSFLVLSYSIGLKSYKSVKFFEDDRFEQLLTKDSYDLLSDFLYQMKESYDFNKKRCSELVYLFNLAYSLFFIMVVTSIVFVASIILGFGL